MTAFSFPFSMSSGPISLTSHSSAGIRHGVRPGTQPMSGVVLGDQVLVDLNYSGPMHVLAEPRRVDIKAGRSMCAELELPEGGQLRIWLIVEEVHLIGYDAEGAPVWRIQKARCVHETTLPRGTHVDDIPPRSTQS